MHHDTLWQGLELMVAGMGMVYVFLALMVGAMNIMSKLVARFLPPAVQTALRAGTKAARNDPSAEELAVISAALALHRKRRHLE